MSSLQKLSFNQKPQQTYQQNGYVMVSPSYLYSSPISMTSNSKSGVKIPAHLTFILKCRFRPDGLAVVTTSADQSTKMWSTNNHKLVRYF